VLRPQTSSRFQGTALIELDPELVAGLAPEAMEAVRRETQVPTLELAPGPWDPGAVLGAAVRRVAAIVVIDGLLIRELTLGGSTATELLGPGDLTSAADPDDRLLPVTVRWTAATPTRLALLDGHLLDVVQRRPVIASRLVRRASAQTDRLEVTRAISQLPRIDQRLLALFWHLAERWGRVGSTGVIVPLSLTHVTLGQLVGARRPTVSLALKELAASGTIVKRGDGSWLLRHGSAKSLQAAPLPATGAPARLVDVTEDILPATPAPDEGRTGVLGDGDVAEADLADLTARVRLLRRQCEAQRLRVNATIDRARATRQRTAELRAAIKSTNARP
jgi:CRP/FNR family cyclic AMP-dependent transcriptional regulator